MLSMILTEEEARTKWCPEARVAIDAQGYSAANRFGDDGKSYLGSQTFCIGSACMAWRWSLGDGIARVVNNSTLTGFCGKAGKP